MGQSPPVLTGKPHPREVKRHGLGSHSKLVGSQTRACSLPLGLGRLVCAQAEDAQRKSGTNKDVHLRC